ncbi:MAG: NAD(P)H-hydrate epimerase, partial [Candidatus Omnitrophica bacterium]|nr:NAD(P)H-hydrate epimerase [Candidatus Omnitrophota bacterium]
ARILKALRVELPAVSAATMSRFARALRSADLVIDALLGVGVSGEVRRDYRDTIELINTHAARVLAVDIPSGLDATTGRVHGSCVRADRTITFVARKQGMMSNEGKRYCGHVVVGDLGIPL